MLRLYREPTVDQLVRKFPAFYGTRKLVTVFLRAQLVKIHLNNILYYYTDVVGILRTLRYLKNFPYRFFFD